MALRENYGEYSKGMVFRSMRSFAISMKLSMTRWHFVRGTVLTLLVMVVLWLHQLVKYVPHKFVLQVTLRR